uniref:SAM domain-containing protein n=1 Tax=Parastrongyloides trichosuri TaxID=131310 RepID=A0A0N4ZG40_PARTI
MIDTRVINQLISIHDFVEHKQLLDELLKNGYIKMNELNELNGEKLTKMGFSSVSVEKILMIVKKYVELQKQNPIKIVNNDSMEVDGNYCNPKSIFAHEHEDRCSSTEQHKKIVKDYLTGKRDKLTPKLASTMLFIPKITDYDIVKATKEREVIQNLIEEREKTYRKLAKLNMDRDKFRRVFHEKGKVCSEINSIVNDLFNEIRSDPFYNHPNIRTEIKKLISELEPYYINR